MPPDFSLEKPPRKRGFFSFSDRFESPKHVARSRNDPAVVPGSAPGEQSPTPYRVRSPRSSDRHRFVHTSRLRRSARKGIEMAVAAARESSVVAVVRGRLVALPEVRIIAGRRRSTSFDLACVADGRRVLVPVVAVDVDIPALKTGDDVTVLGHVRRRFWRVNGRVQGSTEVVAEEIAATRRGSKIAGLHASATRRFRGVRTARLPDRE